MIDSEKLLHKYYLEDNYEVVVLNKNKKIHNNICYIFFSSNALYKDRHNVSTIENMHKINRYEWKFISSNKKVIKKAGKLIFLRDIFKCFYTYGVNNKINNIDKIVEMLVSETNGMEVVLVGSSAGAYMALLVGNLLPNTIRIISLGAVVSLIDFANFSSWLSQNLDSCPYPNITAYLKSNYWIINFYGKFNNYDLNNSYLLEKYSNNNKLINIGFKTGDHAPRPSVEDLIKVLTCSEKHLRRLKCKITNKNIVSKNYLSIINVGIIKLVLYKIKRKLLFFTRKCLVKLK